MGWMTESTLIPKQPVPIDIKKKSLDEIKLIKEQKKKDVLEQKEPLFSKKILDSLKNKRIIKQVGKAEKKMEKLKKEEKVPDEEERELNMIKKAAEYQRMKKFGNDEFANSNKLVVFDDDEDDESEEEEEEPKQREPDVDINQLLQKEKDEKKREKLKAIL